MNSVISFEDNSLFLHTGLSESDFAKARLSDKILCKGLKAERTQNGWQFEDWQFTESVSKNSEVLFSGTAFSGHSLKYFFENREAHRPEFYAASAVSCTAISEALHSSKSVPQNGAGGIFISDDFSSVIFVPEEIFSIACENAGADAAEEDVLYKNEYLSGSAQNNFILASIAYTALTEKLPYAQKDLKARSEDILDARYIPLKYSVWALDEQLSLAIDSILSSGKGSPSGKDSGEHKSFPLDILYRELGLSSTGRIPKDGELFSVIRKSSVSQEKFLLQAEKAHEKSEKKIARKRWIRHNQTKIFIALASVLVVSVVSLSYWSSQQTKPTTLGLTSEETVEMFYSAYNLLDVDACLQSGTGRGAKKISDIISNIFVSSKTRSIYDGDRSTLPPAQWLVTNVDGKNLIFGLTQFTVDGMKKNIFRQGPRRRDVKTKLTEQDGLKLEKGMQEKHTIHYYLVNNDAEDLLSVMEQTDEITLTWNGTRWLITEIYNTENEITDFSWSEFVTDYKKCFYGENIYFMQAASSLREKYFWLSTNSEIIEAATFAKVDSEILLNQTYSKIE